MEKLNVAIIFGGCSSEHEVSCVSGKTIIEAVNKDKYDVTMIGITKEGKWLKVDSVEAIADGSWKDGKVQAMITPDRTVHGALIMEEGKPVELLKIDVAFPVMHGLYGEDGTIQGLFELAGIPYVGCGVLCSAASMDKFYTKIIAATAGVRQAAYTAVFGEDVAKDVKKEVAKVEAEREYPVFVKPSRAGSSQGVSKASNREELETALILAAQHDRKILVEEAITGREIECAVFGGLDSEAYGVGEIVAGDEWYSYEAKYNNADSKTIVDPELPEGAAEKVKEAAVKVFRALDGFGLSRVDFFVQEDGEVILNEINTLPGHTAISMFPMIMTAHGVNLEAEVDRLIQMSFDR